MRRLKKTWEKFKKKISKKYEAIVKNSDNIIMIVNKIKLHIYKLSSITIKDE